MLVQHVSTSSVRCLVLVAYRAYQRSSSDWNLYSFTAYINRIRGYQADRLKAPGFGQGIIDSYYYALPENKMRMREYWPVSGAVYAREFPISWRNIDQGIEELSNPTPY
jgi:hypothetical protein